MVPDWTLLVIGPPKFLFRIYGDVYDVSCVHPSTRLLGRPAKRFFDGYSTCNRCVCLFIFCKLPTYAVLTRCMTSVVSVLLWFVLVAPPGESGSCSFYDLPYDNLTDDVILEWKWDDNNPYKRNETPTLECDQWIYDRSFFQSSAVTKVGGAVEWGGEGFEGCEPSYFLFAPVRSGLWRRTPLVWSLQHLSSRNSSWIFRLWFPFRQVIPILIFFLESSKVLAKIEWIVHVEKVVNFSF